jgi:hypothetical protein
MLWDIFPSNGVIFNFLIESYHKRRKRGGWVKKQSGCIQFDFMTIKRHHDTQHVDIQHDDNQHNNKKKAQHYDSHC